MDTKKRTPKAVFVSVLVLGITWLHYGTHLSLHHYHIFYRELYYLPIVLAAFWFGLRGALTASLSITVLYSPFVVMYWQGFSPDDFHQLMELALNNGMGVLLGSLRDHDLARQKELCKIESLAAMGEAISCVAHDMKTPLIAIGGFSLSVQKSLSRDDPAYDKLERVILEARRLEDMMRDMLDFAKPLELRLSFLDLNAMTLEVTTLIKEKARERTIGIETRLEDNLPPVQLDGTRFQRVLANLVLNAVEASPEGETVTVRTCGEKSSVLLDVSDHGPGICNELKAQVFTPFFTTKKHGTGLGLSIAHRIVEAHSGELKILDNKGKGCTFRVVLPITEDPQSPLCDTPEVLPTKRMDRGHVRS